jgi:amino-acid N-acetyltransferase
VIIIRPACPEDLEAIHALLRACRLPTEGVSEILSTLTIAEVDRSITGVVGLEIHERDGLLRSLAVAEPTRGARLGSLLCAAIEEQAEKLGLRRVFALTETAELFFHHRGYRAIPRSQAPAGIAASREFSVLCPTSAVLMQLDLPVYGRAH